MAGGNNAKVDDLVKLQYDHAWRWFDFHGKQRTTLFNYFLIITGIFANALVISFKEEYYLITGVISFLGAITSLGFLMFDIRNRYMTSQAENVLEKLERDTIYENFKDEKGKQLGPLLEEKATGMREGQKRSLKSKLLKHKLWIRGIEIAVGVCFLFGIILSIVGPHGKKVPDLQRLHEQVTRLELATQDLANRIDKIQIPTTKSPNSQTSPFDKQRKTK